MHVFLLKCICGCALNKCVCMSLCMRFVCVYINVHGACGFVVVGVCVCYICVNVHACVWGCVRVYCIHICVGVCKCMSVYKCVNNHVYMFVWCIRVCTVACYSVTDSLVWFESITGDPDPIWICARCGPDTLALRKPTTGRFGDPYRFVQ